MMPERVRGRQRLVAEHVERRVAEMAAIERRDEVQPALDRLLAAPGAMLLHVRIDPRSNVWPLVPPGRSNAQMMGAAIQ